VQREWLLHILTSPSSIHSLFGCLFNPMQKKKKTVAIFVLLLVLVMMMMMMLLLASLA
jgi:hypothetical protein